MPLSDGYDKSYDVLLISAYGIQNSEVGSTKMRSSPLDFSFAGSYNYIQGRVYYVDDYGDYWSSKMNGIEYAYYLFFNSSSVEPMHTYYKAAGRSIRCVAH